MRMMSICLTWFLISGLGEPNIYHDLGVFYKNVGILLGGCLTVKNQWGLLTGDDGVEMIINTLSGAGEAGNQELESVKRPSLSQTDLRFVFAAPAGSR